MKVLRVIVYLILIVSITGCDFIELPNWNSILVVDLNAVAKATGRQELMQKELELANTQLSEQLKLVASRLEDSIEEEKLKIGKSPSKAQQQQLEQLVAKAQNQLINTKNLAVQKSSDFRADLIQQFRKEVSEIAQNVARRSGSKLVLVSNYETIWFDPSADITDEVIAIMRARNNVSIEKESKSKSKTTATKETNEK